MHKIHSTFAILRGQISDWFHSPRTLFSILVILALTYMNARSYVFSLESNALYSHFGECVSYYLSTGFGNVSLVSALFLVMIAEVPRCTLYQNAMLIRTTRFRWLMSQVLFCLSITMLMLIAMLLLSVVMTIPHLFWCYRLRFFGNHYPIGCAICRQISQLYQLWHRSFQNINGRLSLP